MCECAVSSWETLLSSFRKMLLACIRQTFRELAQRMKKKIDEPGTFVRINRDKKDKKKPGQTVPSISVYVTPRSVTDSFSEVPRDVDDSESMATNLVSRHLVFCLRMDWLYHKSGRMSTLLAHLEPRICHVYKLRNCEQFVIFINLLRNTRVPQVA